jgi:hypothetical protein
VAGLMDMRWTEDKIAHAIVGSCFPYRRYVAVPNVSWGLLPHEVDLAVLAPSGYLYEVEIKISVHDFNRDARKWKHKLAEKNGSHELIRGFYFAMPGDVYEKVRTKVPLGVGVITCGAYAIPTMAAKILRRPSDNPRGRRLTEAEQRQLLRLGYLRYWGRQDAAELIRGAVSALERGIAGAITEAARA